MTQIAKVKQILSPGVAEVAVTRQGACGHSCEDCGDSCMMAKQPDVVARARNSAGARPGDRVVVESASAPLLGIAAFVYLLPMAALILGYFLGETASLSQGFCILTGAACFVLSMAAVILLDRQVRRKNAVEFTIVQVKNT